MLGYGTDDAIFFEMTGEQEFDVTDSESRVIIGARFHFASCSVPRWHGADTEY